MNSSSKDDRFLMEVSNAGCWVLFGAGCRWLSKATGLLHCCASDPVSGRECLLFMESLDDNLDDRDNESWI